jgi:membrane carboxypeptidase/penicillin-binding protein PbpC
LDVRAASGEVIYTPPAPVQERVIDERVAWLISDILSDNDARRLGFGPTSLLRIDRPAAVKTGTTSNFHDNWTVGYTPDLVVGVWSGNTSYESMRGVNGLSGAGPIWHQFIRAALAGRPAQPFERPAGLRQARVCALSGLLPGEHCPYTRQEWFIDGTQPQQTDFYYREVFVDAETGALAQPDGPPERRRRTLALDLPPQAFAWARSHGLTLYTDLQRAATAQAGASGDTDSPELPVAVAPQTDAAAALHLISPAAGSRFRLSAMLPAQDQRIRVEAVGPVDLRGLLLFIDGRQVARFTAAPYAAWWPLAPGQHRAYAQATLPDGAIITSPEIVFSVE